MNATADNSPKDSSGKMQQNEDSETANEQQQQDVESASGGQGQPETQYVPEQLEADIVAAMQQARSAAADDAVKAGGEAEDSAALKDMKEQLLRAVAEAENTRKRAKREVEDAAKYAVASFARDLISVLENLQRASESIPPDARSENEMLKTMGEGVDLTLKELLSAFEKHGITRINPLGEKFDHNLHQAVVQIEDANHPAGTVVQVMQAGYLLKDRLLRPAMVGVAKAPATSQEAPPPVDTQA